MSELFPPVDHQSVRTGRRFRRIRSVPFRVVLPNMVTLLALCAGLTAIRMALEGRFLWAIAAVVLAALLDAVDGRVARWLKGTSRFGAELDSLADFVNFGVVPGLLLYIWTLRDVPSFGWLAVLAYAIACALRLARFNVMSDVPKPDWHANFFTGMPAPAGAITVLLPLYLSEWVTFPMGRPTTVIVAIYMVFIAFMMVSTIPTFSGKKIGARIPRERVIPMSIVFVLVIAALVTYPLPILSIVTVIYLGYIPFGWRLFKRLEAAHQPAATEQPATEEVATGPVEGV